MWDFFKQGLTHSAVVIGAGILFCFEKGAFHCLAIYFNADLFVLHLLEIVSKMILGSMIIIHSSGFIIVYYKKSELHRELKEFIDYILNLGKK